MIPVPAQTKVWLAAGVTVSDKAASCPLDRVNRQFQAPRLNAERIHLLSLPVAFVTECGDAATLERLLWWLTVSDTRMKRPLRGKRQDAPQTPLIVAAKNRLAQLARASELDAIPEGDNWQAVHDADRDET